MRLHLARQCFGGIEARQIEREEQRIVVHVSLL
jgi:hypothetical protein